MKGIMATLLTLGLTGMVSGQQPQNNLNSFNPQRFAQNTATSTGSQNLAKWEPLTLDLDEPTINELKRVGSLIAEIDPVDKTTGIHAPLDTINGILFTSNAPSATSTFQDENKPYELISPIGKQDGTLVFEFDDYLIGQLKQRNLQYRFSEAELGRFQEVRVIYKGLGIGQTPSALGSDQSLNPARLDSIRRVDNFGNQNTGNQNREERFANARPNDGLREYDRDYMGPTRSPALSSLDDRRANFSPQPSNDPLTRPQWSSNPNPGNVPSRLGAADGRSILDPPDNRSWDRRDAMPLRESLDNSSANNRGNFSNENFMPTSRGGDPQTASLADNNSTELEWIQRNNENRRNEARLTQLDLDIQETLDLEAANLQRKQLLESKRRNENASFGDDIIRRTNTTANDNRQFANSSPTRFAADPPNDSDTLVDGDRWASRRSESDATPQPTNGGVRDLSASIAGKNEIDTTMSAVLFFMLMTSLGLNIYLGWLTRGFYVRYNELADELRETFTATM